MYGDMPIVDIKTRLKQIFCWHNPKIDDYYDYSCPKCGFYSDISLTGIKLRHLGWLLTKRLPITFKIKGTKNV